MADKNPNSTNEPSEPAESEINAGKPKKEETPLWARRTVLDWYAGLGMKGRLLYLGVIFLAFNAITWFFGFYFPKMLCVGDACLVIGLVISND